MCRHAGLTAHACTARLQLGGSPVQASVYVDGGGKRFMRWCGLLLACDTLEVQADYSRYSGTHISTHVADADAGQVGGAGACSLPQLLLAPCSTHGVHHQHSAAQQQQRGNRMTCLAEIKPMQCSLSSMLPAPSQASMSHDCRSVR